MRVLVACEESQAVCIAFRMKGHEAYSCDIQECSGNHPEWHIRGDALSVLQGGGFETMDGLKHQVDHWDLLIAHPPCTDLAVSGAAWFDEKRKDGRQQKSIVFFMQLMLAPCDRIAVENPIGVMSTYYRKPDQIIQPWMFGDTDNKRTCLWLKGLPPLKATSIVPKEQRTENNFRAIFNGKQYAWNDPMTAKLRSKTYPGIAKAMADQWGGDAK